MNHKNFIKNDYVLIRSSTEHNLFMYLTSSIIIKRHKHQIFWDQLARRAANNLLIKPRNITHESALAAATVENYSYLQRQKI